MVVAGRHKSIAFFIALSVGLISVILLLYIGWVLLNWRTGILLFFGVLLLALIISGVILNTTFLIREIRRNEQHGAFINAVTHELKTPVASIRLYLETLLTRTVEEKKRKEFYRIMLDDSDRLLATIEQILRTGRVGSSNRLVNFLPVDLNSLIENAIKRARALYDLQLESLKYNPDVAVKVLGDEEELRAAMSNLIDNAVKYSRADVNVVVETSKLDNRYVSVLVRDHGIGIPKSELKRIFKRFYRITGPNTTGLKGTGLGLYIVRSVAKRHGGRTWAESGGAWTRKYVRAPASDFEMNRVLIVEDEIHLAEGLRFNLEAEGYQTQVVRTGEAALELLLTKPLPFDVLVLDVMLPDRDGFSVISETRQAGQLIPTLMLTARSHSEDVLKGFAVICPRNPHMKHTRN